MGVFLLWDKQNPDSAYDQTQIFRSDTEEGTFNLIATQGILDYTFYDQTGSTDQFYKIRFVNTESGDQTEFSDVIQAQERYLYTNPLDVIDAAGLNPEKLPQKLNLNKIFDIIWDVSRGIDDMRQTLYGRKETFAKTQSSRFMDLKRSLNIENIRDVDPTAELVVERRLGDDSWRTMRFRYEYDIEYKSGRLIFYFDWIHQYKAHNDIKISGTYGNLEIPEIVKRYSKIVSAQKVLLYLVGGSFENVATFSMGSVSYSIGQAYVNIKEAYNMLDQERLRIIREAGWGETKTRMRVA